MFCQRRPIQNLGFIPKTNQAYKNYLKRIETEKGGLSLSAKLEFEWTSKLGKEAEGAVRAVLQPDLPFSERSVMRFGEYQCGKWWGPKYRELDLVCWLERYTPLIIEVKSCTPRSFHKQIEKGIQQSEINLDLLESRFPNARAALILVNRSVLPLPEFKAERLVRMESVHQFHEIKAGELVMMHVDAPTLGLSYVDGQYFRADTRISRHAA